MRSKLLATLLALTLAMGMTCTVFADDNTTLSNSNKEGTTILDYTVSQTYTITIPASVTLTGDSANGLSGTAKVSASDILIENGKELKVKMTSQNAGDDNNSADNYKLTCGTVKVSSIVYTIKKDTNDVKNGDIVLAVKAGEQTGSDSVTLSLAASSDAVKAAIKAGQHTDTLTFTVSVEDQSE